MKKKTVNLIIELFAILTSLLILLPFYMIVINSFKGKGEAAEMGLGLPKVWEAFENYRKVFEIGNLINGYKNSIIVSTATVLLLVFFSSMAAFVIQRRNKGIVNFVNISIVLGMTIPMMLVPTCFILKMLNLNGTFTGFVLVSVAAGTPITVFLYTGFFKGVPRSLDESAVLDGCGPIRMFFRVIFPLVKPVTITVIVISFMTVWNNVSLPLYILGNPKKYTVVLTTYMFYGERNAYWNLIFADIILVSLPVIILYFLLQKYIVSGMTAGAIKG